jgi:hypothetical protein
MRRANQGHIGAIADIVEPALKTGCEFSFLDVRPKQFQFVETIPLHFMQFGNG